MAGKKSGGPKGLNKAYSPRPDSVCCFQSRKNPAEHLAASSSSLKRDKSDLQHYSFLRAARSHGCHRWMALWHDLIASWETGLFITPGFVRNIFSQLYFSRTLLKFQTVLFYLWMLLWCLELGVNTSSMVGKWRAGLVKKYPELFI